MFVKNVADGRDGMSMIMKLLREPQGTRALTGNADWTSWGTLNAVPHAAPWPDHAPAWKSLYHQLLRDVRVGAGATGWVTLWPGPDSPRGRVSASILGPSDSREGCGRVGNDPAAAGSVVIPAAGAPARAPSAGAVPEPRSPSASSSSRPGGGRGRSITRGA
jgi:hypothetical protein